MEKIEGISSETMLLLWSMKEKHNSNSNFKLYFDTLPAVFNTGFLFFINFCIHVYFIKFLELHNCLKFSGYRIQVLISTMHSISPFHWHDSHNASTCTGLSFGVNAIMALDGTILLEEIVQAKEVISLAIYFSQQTFRLA